MSTLVLNDVKVFYGQFDISGDLNKVNLEYGANALADTTFGKTTKTSKGGLKTVAFGMGGLMQEDTTAIGKVLFDRVGTNDVLLSVVPESNTYGNVAYLLKSVSSSFAPGAQVGEMYAFSASATASGKQPLVRGRLEAAKAARTTTGGSTGSQLGLVGAGQKLYCALHVFAASGTNPTLDVAVKSDDNSGFSSQTTRLSMTQATGVTSELKTVAGAIATDDYWKVTWTIGGTDPSFTFAAVIGIL